MEKVFVLASGRSGTRFLSGIFKNNVKNCISKHEPKPDMFSKSIYYYKEGIFDLIDKEFKKKKQKIMNYNYDVYIETNHSFLKSFSDVAIITFPNMKLIHLIRNPLKVARSELNRQVFLDKIHYPFVRYYKVNNKKYFKWALTWEEYIFKYFDDIELTKYQKYLIQWIEIENRAINFLNKYNKHDDCYTLHTPKDLNDYNKIKELFDFLNVKLKNKEVILKGRKNRTPVKTIITEEEKRQFKDIIKRIPDKYLEIFKKPPYTNADWISIFEE